MKSHYLALAVTMVVAAGCSSSSTQSPPPPAMAPALMDDSVPQVARNACLAEVRRTTNNPDLAIIEMLYSEANSQVKIGVGPARAPWQCLVSNSGVVAEVMSLTNEGAL